MQGNEKPRAWGNRQRGANRESGLMHTTPNTPKNQQFENSKLRSAIDIAADVSSLIALSYLLACALSWAWRVTS